MRLSFENRNLTLAARTATHLYLRPHPALRPFVAHYTLCPGGSPAPTGPAPPLTLIPDARDRKSTRLNSSHRL